MLINEKNRSEFKDILLTTDASERSNLYNLKHHETQMADQKVENQYHKYKRLILQESETIQAMAEQVVENNNYVNCNRGFFGAMILDLDTNTISSAKFNMPAPNMLEACRFSKEECTRSIINAKHGQDYSMCPATHARERINVSYDESKRNSLIWIEGGAVLSEGKMKFWDIRSLSQQIYPCIRCLNFSLLQGVNLLAALNRDTLGKWDVTLHSFDEHAELLLINNTLSRL